MEQTPLDLVARWYSLSAAPCTLYNRLKSNLTACGSISY